MAQTWQNLSNFWLNLAKFKVDSREVTTDQPPPVLHQWWKYLKPLDLSSRVHIVQEGGCSNNLELIKDHTNSLVAVEAARVVLRRLEPV